MPDPFVAPILPENRPILIPQSGTSRSRPNPAIFCRSWIGRARFCFKIRLPQKSQKNRQKLRRFGIRKMVVLWLGGWLGASPVCDTPLPRESTDFGSPIGHLQILTKSRHFLAKLGWPTSRLQTQSFASKLLATKIAEKLVETEAFWGRKNGRFVVWQLGGCHIRLVHPFGPKIDRFWLPNRLPPDLEQTPVFFAEVGLANLAASNAGFCFKTRLPQKSQKNGEKLRRFGIEEMVVLWRGGWLAAMFVWRILLARESADFGSPIGGLQISTKSRLFLPKLGWPTSRLQTQDFPSKLGCHKNPAKMDGK